MRVAEVVRATIRKADRAPVRPCGRQERPQAEDVHGHAAARTRLRQAPSPQATNDRRRVRHRRRGRVDRARARPPRCHTAPTRQQFDREDPRASADRERRAQARSQAPPDQEPEADGSHHRRRAANARPSRGSSRTPSVLQPRLDAVEGPVGYCRMFTARATIRPIVTSDTSDWIPMMLLAVGESGMVSVGLNAKALVSET